MFNDVVLDDPELDAQVPASVPPGPGQRHPPAPLLHLQDLRLQRVCLHWRHGLPEREGHTAQDRPQPLRQGLQRDRGLKKRSQVSLKLLLINIKSGSKV